MLAGWKQKEILEGIEPVLRLAEAGNLDLAKASSLTTDSLSAMGLTTKDLPHYLDVVAQTARSSNTDIDQMAQAYIGVGGTLKGLNVPLEESAVMIGMLANKGIKGGESATALNAIINNLTAPTGRAKKALDEIGFSAFDSEGKFKGLTNVLTEVKEKTKGMTEEQRNTILSMIGGKEHIKDLNALLSGLDGDYGKLTKAIGSSDGALNDMASTMQGNTKGSITELKSAFEELQISISQAVLPILNKIVKVVLKITNAFNALPQPVKSAIGILIGSVALLAPVFLVLGKLVKSVSTVIGAFKKLSGAAKIFKMLPGMITPHTLIIVGAILAIGLVVYEVIKHWDKLTAAAKKMGEVIAGIFKGIGDSIKLSIEGWKLLIGGFVDWGKEKAKNIADGFLNGVNKVKGLFKGKGKELGGGVKEGFEEELEIQSPSRVFSRYGAFIGEGLVQGIDKQEDSIDNKFRGLGNRIKGLGSVKPEFKNLDVNGVYGESSDLKNINNSNKQLSFNPVINMHVTISDTGGKGTEQLTQEVKGMATTAFKDSLVDLFMADAIRS
ncbi:phage tail tape measure protein [Clostridium algidicarnis]|uniref:phage tail tape measure protein n=1 Tax=Clostridium algidicarnis TaxID=37659 RepID=UPI001C0DF35D|nr:phage tail tape measure protein [Clostridium algidicarnis]MBU3208516.1 phage tail tape measure protein [Clostridium algidicarnis]